MITITYLNHPDGLLARKDMRPVRSMRAAGRVVRSLMLHKQIKVIDVTTARGENRFSAVRQPDDPWEYNFRLHDGEFAA